MHMLRALGGFLGFLKMVYSQPVFSTATLPTQMTGLHPTSAEIDYLTCSAWTSASAGVTSCAENFILVGIGCSGIGCSKIQIKCCRARGTHNGSLTATKKQCSKGLTEYIPEAELASDYATYLGPARELRHKGEHRFATAVGCQSSTITACDEINIRGRRLMCGDTAYLIEDEWRDGQCSWTDWIGAETTVECPQNTAITGIDCTGLNCERIRVQCCAFGHVCPKGTYGDNIFCHQCPLQYYGDENALTTQVCSGLCPKGYYAMTTGLKTSACSAPCPRGTYKDTLGGAGVSSCKPCPAGVYGDSVGLTASTCTAPCPAGTYRPTVGAASVKDCRSCPRGTYQTGTGSTTCIECPDGKYQNKIGATKEDDCKACHRGYRGTTCRGDARAVGG